MMGEIRVPDSLHKFLIFVGVILFAGLIYQLQKVRATSFKALEDTSLSIHELNMESIKYNTLITGFKETAKDLSETYGVKSPVSWDDSLVYYIPSSDSSENYAIVCDSLSSIWGKVNSANLELQLVQEKLKYQTDKQDNIENELIVDYVLIGAAYIIGLIFLFSGYSKWDKIQSTQNKILESQLPEEDKYSFCQSCAKTFTFYLKRGKDEHGEASELFCEECYLNGDFRSDMSRADYMKQFDDALVGKKKKEVRRLKARFESLERWKEDEYL